MYPQHKRNVVTIPGDRSIIPALAAWQEHEPDRPALVFLDAEGTEQSQATYGRLWSDIRRMAWLWREQGVTPGAVVLLAMNHSYELVVGFLGAIYAGALPLILPYARPDAPGAAIDRLTFLVDFTAAAAVLAPPHLVQPFQAALAGNGVRVFGDDLAIMTSPPPDFACHERAGHEALYLQLTSGTTGAPKIAVLAQDAVRANLHGLGAPRYRDGETVVGCMPFHHDGGLVLCLLIPLVNGQRSVQISPLDWVARPELLWHAVTSYQGALTFLPNFALNFMTRRIPDPVAHNFRLDSLATVIVAAELTTQTSVQAFLDRFGPCGLHEQALCAAYGMAEQVAGVSITPHTDRIVVEHVDHTLLRAAGMAKPVSEQGDRTRTVLSCGVPIQDTTVRIVSADEEHAPDRTVGEIQVKSKSSFSGYFRRPDLTALAMDGEWYRTGDLGYTVGKLIFVLGRIDDLIIAGGQNLQPQAIEEIATAVLGAHGRLAVAFGLRDEALGTERPVLVCETLREESAAQLAAWRSTIYRQVLDQLEVRLADIRFVAKGWVVQSDAKIGRKASRAKYLAAGFDADYLDYAMHRGEIDDAQHLGVVLAGLAAQMLGLPALQPADDLTAAGADSLTLLRYVLKVEEILDRRVPVEFFRAPTPAHLAQMLCGNAIDSRTLAPVIPAGSVDPTMTPAPAMVAGAATPPLRWKTQPRQWSKAYRDRFRQTVEHAAARLPYARGMRLLMQWCGKPWVQTHLYAQETKLLQYFAHSMGWTQPLPARAIGNHLTGAWLFARWWAETQDPPPGAPSPSPLIREIAGAVDSDPRSALWQRYFAVAGAEHMALGQREGRGTILVMPHSPVMFGPRNYLASHGQLLVSVGDQTYRHMLRRLHGAPAYSWSGRQPAARAAVAMAAYQCLGAGGMVLIAGDEEDADSGRYAMIGDRAHHLMAGFAELAVQSNAIVLPVHVELVGDGRMRLVIAAPLQWERDGTDDEQVSRLVAAYGAELTKLFRQQPGIWMDRRMRQHLALPRADHPDAVDNAVRQR